MSEAITLSTPWLVFACILSAISLVMMFVPRTPACVVGYMAMWAAQLSGYMTFTTGTLIFWGVAVLIVVINRFLLPAFVRNSRVGVGFIAGGAIAGMAVGLTMYRPATLIGGSILGAVLGAIAYARTGRGAALQFPTTKFFNYLGAKGIPAVIAASMSGMIISGLIIRNMGV